MPQQSKTKEYGCRMCGKRFTSRLRRCHHVAAEHPIKTSSDIRTIHDIPHLPKKATLITVQHASHEEVI